MRNAHPATSLAVANAARPQTQVECYLKELASSIEQLDKQIHLHQEKIEPVLTPCAPQKSGGEVAVPEEAICSVADRLRSHCKAIDGLRLCLAELTDRAQA